MNMIRRSLVMVVLASAFAGMGLFAASSASDVRSVRSGGSGSSRPSTVTMRSMFHSSAASLPRPAGDVEVRVPDEGLLFYLPYSQAEPFPWVAANRPLLKLAIEDSKLGAVAELAPNAYWITDEWAETLRRDAEGRFAKLYYVVEGEPLMALKTGEKQELIRQAIVRSGYCHAPKQSANVFFVKDEWKESLKSAGCEGVPLDYVVRGDALGKVYKFKEDLAEAKVYMIKEAIVESGSEHVIGKPSNAYYVTPAWHDKIFYGDIKKMIASKTGVKLYVLLVWHPIFYDTHHEGEWKVHGSEAPSSYNPPYTSRHWYKVWLCQNQELVREAIIDSNKGLASREEKLDDVFYVTDEWLGKLKAAGAQQVSHPEDRSFCSVQ